MEIDPNLVKIIAKELGDKTADLFTQFYDGFSRKEQIDGAYDILTTIVGKPKTDDLLKDYAQKYESS